MSWRPAIGLGPMHARRWPSSCAGYWYPLYAFVRRKGHDSDDALDLTEDYFDGLLEKGTVGAADPAKGRFRTFLLADCTHFLSHRREHDRAKNAAAESRPFRSTPATPKDATSASRLTA